MIVDRIIAGHTQDGDVRPGSFATVNVDRIYLQDGNSPTIAKLFAENDLFEVFDPARIGVFFDHSVIWPNAAIADRIRDAEAFCRSLGLTVFRGGEGISHVLAMEQGWFEPGSIVLGADSHTCTGGANQSLALGMGATDVLVAMITGQTWLRCPQTVMINVFGTPHHNTRPKDVLLYALSGFGQEPFLYRSIEWCGDWVENLSADGADTVANMAVEFGAKCAFLPPVAGRSDGLAPISTELAEDGVEILHLDIDGLPPFVSRPHNPANAGPLDDCAGLNVNYVFIGSCTNSRMEDMAETAAILDGMTVHPDVHCLVTPGSRDIFLKAMEFGYVERIMRAGAVVTPPGCGSCLGTQGSVPAAGDTDLSTMNRNFRGRMGNRDADIYLASPLVAAHAALLARIPAASELN